MFAKKVARISDNTIGKTSDKTSDKDPPYIDLKPDVTINDKDPHSSSLRSKPPSKQISKLETGLGSIRRAKLKKAYEDVIKVDGDKEGQVTSKVDQIVSKIEVSKTDLSTIVHQTLLKFYTEKQLKTKTLSCDNATCASLSANVKEVLPFTDKIRFTDIICLFDIIPDNDIKYLCYLCEVLIVLTADPKKILQSTNEKTNLTVNCADYHLLILSNIDMVSDV